MPRRKARIGEKLNDRQNIEAAPTPADSQVEQERTVAKKIVSFPPSASKPEQPSDLACQTSIVVIGPNGAGKSRLGAWMEMDGPQKSIVHRITAQRSLVFPESTGPISVEAAREAFHWATRPANWDLKTYESNKSNLRLQQRYGGQISSVVTAPLNDFDKLLTLLFSDNYNALLERENEELKTGTTVPARETLIRKVQTLWESVLPNRQLVISGGAVHVQSRSLPADQASNPYPAKAMSDGERVVFYLVGQCLCAPAGAIVLVDEPEIHLHKAIQDALWTAVEQARPDCTFVYLTHDLAFAADRVGAEKVCLTDYAENDRFSWFAVEPQQGIPDDVYLEVLGSRKPVLFVEGTAGSLDLELYQLAYPKFTVKPVGGCAAVISATKAFRDLGDMHHLRCFGLVDRDHLDASQIAAYKRSGIYTPTVAEVENLYLIPELIAAVANQLMLEERQTLERVQQFVIDMFQRELKSHAMEVMRQRVALSLGQFSSGADAITTYIADLELHLNGIEPRSLYEEALKQAQDMVAANDYRGILQVFNKKGIADQIAHLLDIRRGTYVEKVREMSKRAVGDVPRHLRLYLPDLDALLNA